MAIARIEPAERVPLLVIGGWLGAGKTTLVNHLLRHAGGRRIAVLVNDFGDISIDADLIDGGAGTAEEAANGVIALAGGCVCCSFGSDLLGTLAAVAQRQPAPDLMLLECSGVGLPAAVARSAALVQQLRIDGIAVLLDAGEIRRLARDTHVGDVVRDQLAQADLLVANQLDRLGEDEAAAVDAWLSEQAPGVPRVGTVRGALAPDLLIGLRDEQQHAADAAAERWAKPRWPLAAGAAQRFESFVVDAPAGTDPVALPGLLRAQHPGLLRAKGVVVDTAGRRWGVHVMGARQAVEPMPPVADEAATDRSAFPGRAGGPVRAGRIVGIVLRGAGA